MKSNRRQFIKKSTLAAAGIGMVSAMPVKSFIRDESGFRISLAEWSLHRALFAGAMSNLDFPVVAAKDYSIYGVEYVSTFFEGTGPRYLAELQKVTKDNNVENVLIMIDNEGDLGALYKPERIQAVERHYRWVDAARALGCHSIRVNARGQGTEAEVADAAVDGLGRLSEYGEKAGINVIVENHGGYSSNGKWISEVISRVGKKNCGTLPDFGNFRISENEEYDRYLGMTEMMPFAKGVSAKSHDFDKAGNETRTDYYKMLSIVKNSGYRGYIGIEYEGSRLTEKEGIIATKKLLEKVIAQL
ncbi:MAG: sugar phosphate isomerase/epimerase [Bacteroidales bacterium]|nr:sugar phosphate isomerase/epimerase [Bacteroidales bacterium]MBN2762321.1 sugar phosphate isomerase/epimerase [Bacteroidales bacterium]